MRAERLLEARVRDGNGLVFGDQLPELFEHHCGAVFDIGAADERVGSRLRKGDDVGPDDDGVRSGGRRPRKEKRRQNGEDARCVFFHWRCRF